MNSKFDDIRPYYDSELPQAMQRIAEHPLFATIATYVFPEQEVELTREKMLSIKSIDEFQHQIMYSVNRRIIESSITEISCSGIESLQGDCAYLFVSNHRDIMLDASLLQNMLVEHGLPTSQITFGANLMSSDIVIDIGKSNKMFRVERPSGNMRDFYRVSAHLSDYIRHTLTHLNESVWIAQRNGRTKNGVDRTDRGIINMFRMSCAEDKLRSVADLNIVPVSVSYEWEPCDIEKAREVYISRRGTYTKSADEDFRSILSGILSQKGRVHFALSVPLQREDIEPFVELSSHEFNNRVASLIDGRVCRNYHLWPNNYIAHDMLNKTDRYAQMYTEEERQQFEAHLGRCRAALTPDVDVDEVIDILLGIYAYAVDSQNEFAL